MYRYVYDLQGDVVGILDDDGNLVVEYKYDAWGKPITVAPEPSKQNTLGKLNPFRYRGYTWDQETEKYYNNTRYYDGSISRFLNCDNVIAEPGAVKGNNGFAYCHNNPILLSDSDGTWPSLGNFLKSVLTVAVVVCGVALTAMSAGALAPGLAITGGAVLGGLAGTSAANVVLSISAGIVIGGIFCKSLEEYKEKAPKAYSVYILGDEEGVKYVGRVKTENFDKRMNYHYNNRGLSLVKPIHGLNYAQCRGLEQYYMLYYHTIDKNDAKKNQINGISSRNKNRAFYIKAAIDYLGNQAENEIVNFLLM